MNGWRLLLLGQPRGLKWSNGLIEIIFRLLCKFFSQSMWQFYAFLFSYELQNFNNLEIFSMCLSNSSQPCIYVGKPIEIYRKFLTSLREGGTSWTTVQIVSMGWSFERSEQQKITLLHPLYLSDSHFIYSKASADSFSASYRIIAAKARQWIIHVGLYFNSILRPFFESCESTSAIVRVTWKTFVRKSYFVFPW